MRPATSTLPAALPLALALAAGGAAGQGAAPAGCAAVPDAPPLCAGGASGAAAVVGTPQALREALASAPCGTRVAVAAGTYEGDYALKRECDPARPLVVHAGGAATFHGGTFALDGSGLVLSGLTFDGGGIRVRGSRNRVTRNTVRGARRAAIQARGAHHLIDRNEVAHTDGVGIEVLVDGDASRNFGNRVERNYVHHQVGEGNGHEGIRILTDAFRASGAVIAYNLLDSVDVPNEGEAFSIKTNGVTVRGNTLLNSPRSGITNRFGADNVFEANYTEGSRGMTILGDRHVLRGNVVRGGEIRVHAGNGTQDTKHCPDRFNATLPDCKAVHPAARDVTLADNAADRVVVGFQYANAPVPNDVPARNVAVVRSGRVELRHQTGTRVEEGAPRGALGRRLSRDEVGPLAPEDGLPVRKEP